MYYAAVATSTMATPSHVGSSVYMLRAVEAMTAMAELIDEGNVRNDSLFHTRARSVEWHVLRNQPAPPD